MSTQAMDPSSAVGALFLISAPSGAGKTSLVNALAGADTNIALSVSHTTRAPREGEVDGVHYHFVDVESFERMVEADAFLEHANVFGRRYGTSRANIDGLLDAGRDVVLEIDWQGAAQVKSRYPGAIGIFVFPPSLEVLEQRLRQRALDSRETIDRRLGEAVTEMRQHQAFDYVIVNDDFDRALADLRAVVRASRLTHPRQAARHAALLASLTGAGKPTAG